MNERFPNFDNSEKAGSVDERGKTVEEMFDCVVDEVKEKYKKKTVFEQKLMNEVVIPRIIDNLKKWGWRHDFSFSLPSVDSFERAFNMEINCGGFALEVDTAIFPKSGNLEDAVDNILKTFPFVRLYDWGEELNKDEYLVLYRHLRGEAGHHFVKYEDGKFMDKCGSEPVREFSDWPDCYIGEPQVMFAVNRNHDMLLTDDEKRIWSIFV